MLLWPGTLEDREDRQSKSGWSFFVCFMGWDQSIEGRSGPNPAELPHPDTTNGTALYAEKRPGVVDWGVCLGW